MSSPVRRYTDGMAAQYREDAACPALRDALHALAEQKSKHLLQLDKLIAELSEEREIVIHNRQVLVSALCEVQA